MSVTEIIYFCNELDLLEAHLEHHRPWGWRTVIVESELTLVGTPKPLYFRENKSRFDRFDVESICLPPELVKPVTPKDPYREFRDNDWRKRFFIQENFNAKNKWILHGDVDEIIAQKPCDYDDVDYVSFLLDDRKAQINLRVRHTAHVWRMVKASLPSNLLARPKGAKAKSLRGGWHFTNCPSSPDEILPKAQCRFWYFGVDRPEDIPDVNHFKKMFGKPYDYITGKLLTNSQIIPTSELPPYMQNNLEKFPVNYDDPILQEQLPEKLQKNIKLFSLIN